MLLFLTPLCVRNLGTDKLNWNCVQTKCYKYFHDALVWKDALARCQQIHASSSLAVINSDGENDIVQSILLSDNAWIGLNDLWEAGIFWMCCVHFLPVFATSSYFRYFASTNLLNWKL